MIDLYQILSERGERGTESTGNRRGEKDRHTERHRDNKRAHPRDTQIAGYPSIYLSI